MKGVRVSHDVAASMEAEINSRNAHTKEQPYGDAGFILAAIREKLKKKVRGRESARRKAARRLAMSRLPLALDVYDMLR